MPEPPVRIAVTGDPGSGKTTLIRRVVAAIGTKLTAGGIYTEEIREGGTRVGFEILDIASGTRGILSHSDFRNGPRVGKYRVSLSSIDGIAIPAIESAAAGADVVVVDEIAPMECASARFVAAVEALLEARKPLLFAVHRRARGSVLERIRAGFTLYEVTAATRDLLVDRIACAILGGAPRQEAGEGRTRSPRGGGSRRRTRTPPPEAPDLPRW